MNFNLTYDEKQKAKQLKSAAEIIWPTNKYYHLDHYSFTGSNGIGVTTLLVLEIYDLLARNSDPVYTVTRDITDYGAW